MKQLKTKISENKKIAPNFYKMRVESLYLAKNTKPGQFFEVKCSDGNEPLLRRPLGAHRILKDGVEMLYEVVGKGTELLSRKKGGGLLDIIGPLGNGFTYDPKALRSYAPLLIAGGIGVAPLVALAENIAYSVQRIADRKKQKTYVLIGAKSKNHITCEKDFKKSGCEVIITTEDGSYGKKGLITEYLKLLLQTTDCRLPTIYACGPTAMLKTVANIAANHKIPCQVSLEERMACGVGVCLGCPVRIKNTVPGFRFPAPGYKMVCKDGPVFNTEEIVL